MQVPAAASGRLVSFDAFRGFVMLLDHRRQCRDTKLAPDAKPEVDADCRAVPAQRLAGLAVYDIIGPAFMLMTGASVPFSFAKRSLTQTHREILGRVLRRSAVRFLLGSLRESIRGNAPYLVELSSGSSAHRDRLLLCVRAI